MGGPRLRTLVRNAAGEVGSSLGQGGALLPCHRLMGGPRLRTLVRNAAGEVGSSLGQGGALPPCHRLMGGPRLRTLTPHCVLQRPTRCSSCLISSGELFGEPPHRFP